MKESLDGGKKGFNATASLAIAGLAFWGGEIGRPVSSALGRRFASWLGQGNQHFAPAFGASRYQIAIVIARIQQQGSEQRRQIFHPRLQHMTFTGTARHTGT